MFTCYGCGIHQPLDEFHASKRGKRGHSTRCITCLKLYNDAYRESRKDLPDGSKRCITCAVTLKLGTNWRRCHFTTNQFTCRQCAGETTRRKRMRVSLTTTMYHLARQRARASGAPFEITKADIVIPERCPVLDIELSGGIGKLHAGSPTLDRIDPTKGYVKGNIAVISHRANRLKNNATLRELEAIAEWVRKVSV